MKVFTYPHHIPAQGNHLVVGRIGCGKTTTVLPAIIRKRIEGGTTRFILFMQEQDTCNTVIDTFLKHSFAVSTVDLDKYNPNMLSLTDKSVVIVKIPDRNNTAMAQMFVDIVKNQTHDTTIVVDAIERCPEIPGLYDLLRKGKVDGPQIILVAQSFYSFRYMYASDFYPMMTCMNKTVVYPVSPVDTEYIPNIFNISIDAMEHLFIELL